MSDTEIAATNRLLIEQAHLRSELAGVRRDLAQQQRALAAERDKRRSIERAIRAWADDSNHPAMDCAECEALYQIANGTYDGAVGQADALLTELTAARAVVAVARDYLIRDSHTLPIEPSDVRAAGLLIEAIRQYDTVVKGVTG